MITGYEARATNQMIREENLDVRTITMGINILDCADTDIEKFCNKIYDKITKKAEKLVATGDEIGLEFGIPIVNKRISVTPVALAASSCAADSYVEVAETLDKAAKETGVNFVGGFSALVQKGITQADQTLINSIPEALSVTERVCSSVNVGSSRSGINMDAVKQMGSVIKRLAFNTR
ncbi:MAG: DUF711 family protein, partial [Synergistaceae bacterium]|nr:DUF711 family protein [Synergistaceae bacterium]